MSDQTAYEPEEQIDTWLRRQLAAAAGPPDIGEMSDAQLEKMLDVCGDETYTPDQMERLLARFWIEVSQAQATSSGDKPAGELVDTRRGELGRQRTGEQTVEREATTPVAAPDSQPSTTPPLPLGEGPGEGLPFVSIPDRAAGRQHGSPSSGLDEFVDTAGRGTARRNTAIRRAAEFFAEYTPLLCLAAAVVTGFFLASHWPASRRTEVAISGPGGAAPSNRQLADVGHISGAVDCSFAGGGRPVAQEQVQVGQRLQLDRGLLEITYDAGVRIILQGPATYTVESAQGGFLAVGKLSAIVDGDRRVPDSKFKSQFKSKISAPKFVLGTPSVTVNDLGTEFGVEVRADTVTEVCVFRGEVETVTDAETGFAQVRERLVAGEAIRFASTGGPPQRTTVQSLGAAPLASPAKLLLLTRDARQSQLLAPAGLVATAYHRVWDAHGNLLALGDRRQALQVASDGIFGRGEQDEGPRSSFDTLAAANPQTDFAGLTYDERVRIDRIKVFLGCQFGDGGSWRKPPRVYVLVNPVDSGRTPPEMNPADWRELPPLQQSYGTPFTVRADANPGEVLEFVLTGYPVEHRTGYGWAIGGVKGNGEASYVSITELRAYGTELEQK